MPIWVGTRSLAQDTPDSHQSTDLLAAGIPVRQAGQTYFPAPGSRANHRRPSCGPRLSQRHLGVEAEQMYGDARVNRIATKAANAETMCHVIRHPTCSRLVFPCCVLQSRFRFRLLTCILVICIVTLREVPDSLHDGPQLGQDVRDPLGARGGSSYRVFDGQARGDWKVRVSEITIVRDERVTHYSAGSRVKLSSL